MDVWIEIPSLFSFPFEFCICNPFSLPENRQEKIWEEEVMTLPCAPG